MSACSRSHRAGTDVQPAQQVQICARLALAEDLTSTI